MGRINEMLRTEIAISDGNGKLGNVPNISFPPITYCHNCEQCSKYCYAARLYKRYTTTCKKQWNANVQLAINHREQWVQEMKMALKCTRDFRWFVSGDVLDEEMCEQIVEIMQDNPHCNAIEFTKHYEAWNEVQNKGIKIPQNLHLIYSVVDGTECPNPYNLPTAHILYKDGHTTAQNPTHLCDGNCAMCFVSEKGCLALKNGESVVFKEH